jgi:hypothetical protein
MSPIATMERLEQESQASGDLIARLKPLSIAC